MPYPPSSPSPVGLLFPRQRQQLASFSGGAGRGRGVCGWRRRPKYLLVGAALGETVFVVKQREYQPFPVVLQFLTPAAVCNKESQLVLPSAFRQQSEIACHGTRRRNAGLFAVPLCWPVSRLLCTCGLRAVCCRVLCLSVRGQTDTCVTLLLSFVRVHTVEDGQRYVHQWGDVALFYLGSTFRLPVQYRAHKRCQGRQR